MTSTSAADAEDPAANPPPTGTVAQPIRRSRPPRAAGPPISATTDAVHSVKGTVGVEATSGGRALGGGGAGDDGPGGGPAGASLLIVATGGRCDGPTAHPASARTATTSTARAVADRRGTGWGAARMVGAPQRGTEGRMSARSKLTGRSSWS